MSLFQKVKDFFSRGRYYMQTSNLNSILEHPKIAVNQEEYDRIKRNLVYYQSKWDDVQYKNTDGDIQSRPMNHLPIAKTASKKIASLVYNERATITTKNETLSKFLDDMLINNRFNKNFERYLESCLALGGLAMRPYIDGDKVRVAFIQAPVFFPLDRNTQDVSSAAILTKTIKSKGRKNVYYTLVEFHEWVTADGQETGSTNDKKYYRITNELYRSDVNDVLGQRVNLSELDKYKNLEPVTVFENLSRPLFTYLRTPDMNNKDIDSPLGLSIVDNAKTTIDFLNTTYDEFMWEVKMGQRRVIVPEHLTQRQHQRSDGTIDFKPRFDVEQNVYMQIGGSSMDAGGVTDLTTPIRSDDYIKAINKILAIFEMQIGVSSGTFTFDGKSLKTATEVVSENSDTYQMRNSIVSLVEQSLKELCVSMCELGKAVGIYSGEIPELDDISVNLDDGVFTDRHAELDYWAKMVAAGFSTKKRAIMKTLSLSESEAEKELNAINSELPPMNDAELAIYGMHDQNEEKEDDKV